MLLLKTRRQKLDRLTFARNGPGLAAGGRFGLYWWQSPSAASTPNQLSQLQTTAIGLSPSGDWALACCPTDGIHIYSLVDQSRWSILPGRFNLLVAVSPNEPVVTTCSDDARTLIAWKVANNREPSLLWSFDNGHQVSDLTFTPDGSRLLHFEFRGWTSETDHHLFVVRLSLTGEVVQSSPIEVASWGEMVVSPNGECLAYPSAEHLIIRALAHPSPLVQCIRNPSGKLFTDLAFHPSGRLLAATSNDATVKLYDTANWSLARTYSWDIGRLRSIAFSPDGLLAAAGSDTGKIVVWDVDL